MQNIIVNATALRSKGALNILLQFLGAIPEDEFTYVVFIDESVQFKKKLSNVKIITLNKRSYFSRLLWDTHGLKLWLKSSHITPVATITLQNTNFRVNAKCPNYIYYHQPVPLFPYKWSFFNSNERILWFYKNIYPFFVKLFINPRTKIFVQLNCIKEAFVKKYRIKAEKINVVFPEIEYLNVQKMSSITINKQTINLFYPAMGAVYKNHKILFEALSIIDNSLSKKVVLYLTCDKEVRPKYLYQNIEIIHLDGLSYNEVMGLLNDADACVFPSYIETFGLPLIEAASCGTKVITADLPYAREVLEGYKGVTFVNFQDADAWGNEILRLCAKENKKIEPFCRENTASWNDFFEIIKQDILCSSAKSF